MNYVFGTLNSLYPGQLGVGHQKINKKIVPVINELYSSDLCEMVAMRQEKPVSQKYKKESYDSREQMQ